MNSETETGKSTGTGPKPSYSDYQADLHNIAQSLFNYEQQFALWATGGQGDPPVWPGYTFGPEIPGPVHVTIPGPQANPP